MRTFLITSLAIIAWNCLSNFPVVFCATNLENSTAIAPTCNLSNLESKLEETLFAVKNGFYALDFKVNRLLNESNDLKTDRCKGTETFVINPTNSSSIKIYQSYKEEGTSLYEPMTIIPPLIQSTLTEITLEKLTVDLYQSFLPSIQYACNLQVLNLLDVQLSNWILNNPSTGDANLTEIYLPKLNSYTVTASDRRSGMFKSQLFPFTKGSISKWNTNINIIFEYQQSKLIIEPEAGKLTAVRYSAHVIDTILPNLDFSLKEASFQQCEFTCSLPQSLTKLSFIKTFPGRYKISDFFKDLINLEYLILQNFGKVNLQDLPKSLTYVSFAYVQILIPDEPNLTRTSEENLKFPKIEGMILGNDAEIQDRIIENFLTIFPNLKKIIILSNTKLIPTLMQQPNIQKVLCDVNITQEFIGTPLESSFQSCNPGGKLNSGYCNLYRDPVDGGKWVGNHLSGLPDIATY